MFKLCFVFPLELLTCLHTPMLPLWYVAFDRHVCNELLLYVWPTFNNYPESSQSLLLMILDKQPSVGITCVV